MSVEWLTDFNTEKTEWHHKIEANSFEIDFSIFIRHTSLEELEEFLAEKLDGVDEEVLVRIKENFSVTKKLLERNSDDPSYLAKLLPGVDRVEKNPVSGDEDTLYSIIIELNDTHKWSRDAIADWIESLDDVPTFNTEPLSKETIVVHDYTTK